jgi:hypothetical protein
MRPGRPFYIIATLVVAVGGIGGGWSNNPAATPPAHPPTGYVGAAACKSCHRSIYQRHILTAHYRDSRPATGTFIKGSFAGGSSHFVFNDHMEVLMERKGGHFYQTALFNGKVIESEPFGVVIGSGRKGQTYLYWNDERLFQLPISYYAPLDSWCNSPGYPPMMAYFSKQVHGECMECHGTYAKIVGQDGKGTIFDSASIVYGIDCERCHGPGAEHVAWHTGHPGEPSGRFILNARHLTRQRRLDACALCHSGFRQEIQPAFSFMVGDTLDNYSSAGYDTAAVSTLDVHGNQYGLLTSSRCFRESGQLDCSTCHDPHADEHGKTEVYSRRCISCHDGKSTPPCAYGPVSRMRLTTNCIDCHMPALPSQVITLQVSGQEQPVHDLVRTHRVAIYPAISEIWLREHPKGE